MSAVKSPIQYFGAKGNIADKIVALIPKHQGYIEPYAGSLSVLLAKPASKIEVLNVTRPGGRVLDLYAGSGTTGEAALLEGMEVDLIELEEAHLPLILARVRKPLHVGLFPGWEDAS
jgi:hypothetical protein